MVWIRATESSDIITFGTAVENMINANSIVKIQYKILVLFMIVFLRVVKLAIEITMIQRCCVLSYVKGGKNDI